MILRNSCMDNDSFIVGATELKWRKSGIAPVTNFKSRYVKVKFALEPGGPPGRSLSQFL